MHRATNRAHQMNSNLYHSCRLNTSGIATKGDVPGQLQLDARTHTIKCMMESALANGSYNYARMHLPRTM